MDEDLAKTGTRGEDLMRTLAKRARVYIYIKMSYIVELTLRGQAGSSQKLLSTYGPLSKT